LDFYELVIPAMQAIQASIPNVEFHIYEKFLDISEIRSATSNLNIKTFECIHPQLVGKFLYDSDFDFGFHLMRDIPFNRARTSSKNKEMLFSGGMLPLTYKEYKSKGPTQIYCSKKCLATHRNEKNKKLRKKPVIKKMCEKCNKEFETSRKFQRFCSDCKKIHELERKREYYIKVLKPKFGYLKRGDSYPQKFIYNVILENFKECVWKYDDRSILRNPNTRYAMELDIVCLNRNFAIEYDGEHHFSPKIYGEKNFKYIKELDKIKDKLCEEKNIILLRINYKDDWKDKGWIIKKVGEFIKCP
jgi:hypothetical protein